MLLWGWVEGGDFIAFDWQIIKAIGEKDLSVAASVVSPYLMVTVEVAGAGIARGCSYAMEAMCKLSFE